MGEKRVWFIDLECGCHWSGRGELPLKRNPGEEVKCSDHGETVIVRWGSRGL